MPKKREREDFLFKVKWEKRKRVSVCFWAAAKRGKEKTVRAHERRHL